jgi:hypothetical protein
MTCVRACVHVQGDLGYTIAAPLLDVQIGGYSIVRQPQDIPRGTYIHTVTQYASSIY